MRDSRIRSYRTEESINRPSCAGPRCRRLPVIEVCFSEIAALSMQLPQLVGTEWLTGLAEGGYVQRVSVDYHGIYERFAGSKTRLVVCAAVGKPDGSLKQSLVGRSISGTMTCAYCISNDLRSFKCLPFDH